MSGSATASWRTSTLAGAVLVAGVFSLCAALRRLKLGIVAEPDPPPTEKEKENKEPGLPACLGGPEEVGLCGRRLAAVGRWSDGWVASGKFPGLLTVIARRGKIAFAHGSGYADAEKRRAFELDTIVRIYSMTKPVVAVGIMILYERGLFQLDEKIKQYLPSFAQMQVKEEHKPGEFRVRPAACDITFHHLLTHTSGLAYGDEDEEGADRVQPVAAGRASAFAPEAGEKQAERDKSRSPLPAPGGQRQESRLQLADRTSAATTAPPAAPTGEVNLGYTRRGLGGKDFKSLSLVDFVDRLGRLPLAFDPGTSWKYSYSYEVLGRLIEVVSGQTLDEFLDEAVFRPLRMPDTGFWLKQPRSGRSRVAALYEVKERPPPGGIEVDSVEDRRRFEKHDSYAPVITLRALKPLASKNSFSVGIAAMPSTGSCAEEETVAGPAAAESESLFGRKSGAADERAGGDMTQDEPHEGAAASSKSPQGTSIAMENKAARLAVVSLCSPKWSAAKEEAPLQESKSLPAPVLEVLLSQLGAAGYSRVLLVLGGAASRERYTRAVAEMQGAAAAANSPKQPQRLEVLDLGGHYNGGFALSLAKACASEAFQRLFDLQADQQFLICRPNHLADAHLLQNLARISLKAVSLHAVVLCETDIPPGGYDCRVGEAVVGGEAREEATSTSGEEGAGTQAHPASPSFQQEAIYVTLERTVEAPTLHGLLSRARTLGTEREHAARHDIALRFAEPGPTVVAKNFFADGRDEHGGALAESQTFRNMVVGVEIGAYLCGAECAALLRSKREEFGLAEFFETEVSLLGALRAQGRPWFAVNVQSEKVEILRTSRTLMRQGHAAGRFQLAASRLWNDSSSFSVAEVDDFSSSTGTTTNSNAFGERNFGSPRGEKSDKPSSTLAVLSSPGASQDQLERPSAEVVFSGTRNHRQRAPQQVHVQRFRLRKRLKKEHLLKRDALGGGETPWVVGAPGNTVKQVAAPTSAAPTSLADLSFDAADEDAPMLEDHTHTLAAIAENRNETETKKGGRAGNKREGSTPSTSRYEYDAPPQSRPPMLSGGGGLLSTANDYMRFCQMLLNKGELEGARVLSRRTVEYMRRNHLPIEGPSSRLRVEIADIAADSSFSETSFAGMGFGLGWSIVMDPVKASLLSSPGEHGWGGMASTFFALDPAEDMAILSLAQLVPSDRYPTRRQLRTLVYQALL
mmetsp:Transcript_20334/g.51344  ORF Transcript_20334/g.51344 Transcript_20334/m.51344 type:complete len:1199 (-) Transcript_20334:43-3639(-)|eukprot:CAMPEP_0178994938 /NCGR_PEP_ID=MMETSP0795-20121207/7566_1 /TAXON_ID=88552 /ORGANISM="Amoebophrya sp., Strain Ameob2" /LENGTH=1198 /DNA_ID=CAMNT_0020687223 /DNA_START=632 /DNA_END=4228 /DNA_ORIENTATION=+